MGVVIVVVYIIFNISNVILLIFFVGLLDKFLLFVVKDIGEDEVRVIKLVLLKMILFSVIIE